MTRPFIPLEHGASVRLHYQHTLGGMAHSNLLHFTTPDSFTGNDLVTLAELLETWDTNLWRQCRSLNIALTDMYLRGLDAEDSPAYSVSFTTGHTGLINSAVANAAVTKAVKLQSAYAGRSNRGRLFVPPLPQSVVVSPNSISTAYLADVSQAVNSLILMAHEQTPYMALIVASFRTNKAWRQYGSMQVVDEAVVRGTRIDMQRRRIGQLNLRP